MDISRQYYNSPTGPNGPTGMDISTEYYKKAPVGRTGRTSRTRVNNRQYTKPKKRKPKGPIKRRLKKEKIHETRISESYKRKVIQTSTELRLGFFSIIQQLLDKHLKSNIQCLSETDLSRLSKNFKGPYYLRDFFINMKRIGTPSAYGIVFVACINANMINHVGNKCFTICEAFRKYPGLPQEFLEECQQKDQKLEPLQVAVKLQSLSANYGHVHEDAQELLVQHEDVAMLELGAILGGIHIGRDETDSGVLNVCPWDDRESCETEMFREIRSTRLLTLLLRYGVCPNVPILYQVYLCDSCGRSKDGKVTINEKEIVKKDPCAIIINELSNGDLKTWMKTSRTEEEWVGAIFQIFMGLLGMQLNFGMVHYDFHWGNQLWSKVVNEPWLYNIFDIYGNYLESFMVPTYGNLFKIWDMGKVEAQIGLGRDFTDNRTRNIQRWGNNKPVGKYFNDAIYILRLISYAKPTKQEPDMKKPPQGVLNWIQHSLDYFHNLDITDEGNGSTDPSNFANLITEMFRYENMKKGMVNPPNLSVKKHSRKVPRVKRSKAERHKKTKTITVITDSYSNLAAQTWNVKQNPEVIRLAKTFS
jgi:hypothetical protein